MGLNIQLSMRRGWIFVILIFGILIIEFNHQLIPKVLNNIVIVQQIKVISPYIDNLSPYLWSLDTPPQKIPDEELGIILNYFYQSQSGVTLGNYVLTASADQEYLEVIKLVSEYKEICMKSKYCRIQFGKVEYLSGNYSQAAWWWMDDQLLPLLKLIGRETFSPGEDPESALAYYHVLSSIFPEDAIIYKELGIIHRYWGEWKEAKDYFDVAHNLLPNDSTITCLYAESLVYLQQSMDIAFNLCIEALDKTTDVWLYEKLSRMYEISGDIASARSWLVLASSRFNHRYEPLVWIANFDARH